MYQYYSNIKKFNYKNGIEKNVDLSINKDLITYYNKNKKTHIRIDDIIGIIYGPKTYTFKNVKKCKP